MKYSSQDNKLIVKRLDILKTVILNTFILNTKKMQSENSNLISFDDFMKVEIHAGTVVEVNDFPTARKPAYQLTIDFGERIGMRKSSAQITTLYSKEELVGTQVMAVINFPRKQIGNFFSEVLVLGTIAKDGTVTLVAPNKSVENGERLA